MSHRVAPALADLSYGFLVLQDDIDEETKAYEVTRHALFYNDTGCRNLYKQHIYAIVNRQNSFNG